SEKILVQLIAERGASSETNGILGRVYKDRWEKERDRGSAEKARGLLRKAIQTYLTGFEADWRDAYPGINAATLMEVIEPPDIRGPEILAVVKYAATQR